MTGTERDLTAVEADGRRVRETSLRAPSELADVYGDRYGDR